MNKILNFLKTSDKYFLVSTSFSILVVLLIITIFAYYYPVLPNRLPLFYSLVWGESQLADKQQFFLLPIISILIVLVNIFLALHIHPSRVTIRRILTGSLLIINLIILITAIKIICIFV